MKTTLTLVALLSSLALSSYAAESVTPEQRQAVAEYAKAQGLDKQAQWQGLSPQEQQLKMNNAKEAVPSDASKVQNKKQMQNRMQNVQQMQNMQPQIRSGAQTTEPHIQNKTQTTPTAQP